MRPLAPVPAPPFSRLTDQELIAACAAGESRALDVLFDRHGEAVHRLASRLAGRGCDAEDLVQVTFLTAWKSARAFRGQASVRGWLLAITARVAWRARRSWRRRLRLRSSLELFPVPLEEGVEDAAARREQLRRVRDALERLPYRLRVVYLMCEVEGLSRVEVARALDLPEGTVRRRLHAARRKLVEHFRGERE
jgi:RNA polymerase sigma-70 factor (ECF subfamily)